MDHTRVKLGKLAAKHDDRTLRLANYLTPNLPLPPDSCDWTTKALPFTMAGNDQYGDCVLAAKAHLIKLWTACQGKPITVSDASVVAEYQKLTGGVDSGLVMLDILKLMKNTGIFGHKIGAFLAVDHQNIAEMHQGIYLFGGVDCGWALPLSANGKTAWSVLDPKLSGKNKPGSWGGHDAPMVAYSAGSAKVCTWATLYPCSDAFTKAYCDEMYVILSPDWVNGNAKAPNGFNLATLQSDLARL